MNFPAPTSPTPRRADPQPAWAVEASGLSFSYVPGGDPVLVCDHLAVPAGTVTWLSGRSGSGKSTLMKLMGGLLGTKTGSLVVQGVQLVGAKDAVSARLRASTLGVVLQEHTLIEGLSVTENVQFTAQLAGARLTEDQVRGRLSTLGVDEVADKSGWDISGGQRQRVAIVRALAKSPRMLLLDEPTSALDEANSVAMMELLRTLASEGITSVVISHDPLMERYCDLRVDVVDGRVAEAKQV